MQRKVQEEEQQENVRPEARAFRSKVQLRQIYRDSLQREKPQICENGCTSSDRIKVYIGKQSQRNVKEQTK